eukprot:10141922-Alexandrium_andersonii.AAC.1
MRLVASGRRLLSRDASLGGPRCKWRSCFRSPPRVTRELRSRSLGTRFPVFGPGSTFDFQAGEAG